MAQFNDRRGRGTVDVGPSPSVAYLASLKRPDKPGQASRAHARRLDSAHAAVARGSAAVVPAPTMTPSTQHAPVPSVVHEHVTRSWMNAQPGTVLPKRGIRIGGKVCSCQ